MTLKSMPRLSGMGRLRQMKDMRVLKGGKAFEEEEEEEEPFDPVLVGLFGQEKDEGVALIHRRMGGKQSDLQLARRVWGWQQKEIPHASIPESIVYDYLKLSGRPFVFQQYVYGGRTARNGIVPDFLVESGGEWMVWNVQGEYWHSEGVNEGKDKSQRYRLLGAIILGMKVARVIDMWESDLYNDRPLIWTMAWAGRGLRD